MGDTNEQLEIVDENDEVIGQADRFSIHMRAQLHREVGIFIYNSKGEILLQRRAPDKDVAPNKLDTSVGGHVSVGQTYKDAAILELYEETGIQVRPGELEFLYKNKRESDPQKNGMINKAWRSMYAYRFNDATDTLSVEQGKATSLEWWPIERLLALTEEQKQEFTSFVYKDLPIVIPAIQKRIASLDMLYITYFVHGTTTDNESGIATGWLPGELSALGRRQSVELGEMVSDKKFDVVFCSDLQRAVDSARLAFSKQYDIIQDTRLREANYGDWNGQPEFFKDSLTDYITKPFPNGESYMDVEKRVAGFLEDLSKKYDNKQVAIIGHQAPQLALEVLCNGKTWQQAIATDWRRAKAWQPGWEYTVD